MKRCAYCAAPFIPLAHHQRFCSRVCQSDSYYRRPLGYREEAEDDESPFEWDGATLYSQTEQLIRYRMFCLSCGADRWLRLTAPAVQRLRVARTCQRCGGFVCIEEDVVSRDPATLLSIGAESEAA